MITLVHISDFHFSRAKRRDQAIVVDALVRDLKHLAAVEGVHPSIVIFSGDLVQTGDDLPLFEEAANFLLKPVLDALALRPEKLFLVAGNHDIQRSVVTALSEAAMQSLVNQKEVNSFLDDLLRSPGDFAIFVKRLDNFNAFAQTRPGAMAPAYEDYLTRCYSFTVDSARIAIACLNTAWRATGAPGNSDYGKLLLGERQLDIAIREVADAALRVAVLHHPFEWWAPFERVSLFRRFAESFDLVLTGHTHYADPHLRWDTSGRALISGAGCLYESREYFNGYSIIQFDEQQKSVVVLLREYYDAKRGFDKCLRLADDGKATYSLAVAAPALTVPSSVQMLDSFRRIIDTTAQQVLLSAVHSTSAPRTLAEIFVTPTLRKEPENSDAMGRLDPSASRGKTTSINEIVASTANLIIVGRREAGRTTLLLYIAMWFLDQPPEHARLPFYVNMRQLSGKPRHALRRAMHSFAMDATQRIDVDELLRQSRCVLCLDDFDPRSPEQNEAISALLEQYPDTRLICTTSQESDEVAAVETNNVSFAYEQLFIHSFGRRQIRHLVERWSQARQTNVDELVDSVVTTLVHIGVPRNPSLVSILLLIFERQKEFVAVNRAALIEMFVQILLEKIGVAAIRAETLDFRNQEHYLEYIAGRMVDQDQFTFDRLELERDSCVF